VTTGAERPFRPVFENHVASRPRLKNVEFEDVTVDAVYAQLLRHHTSTPEELAAAVAFSQEQFSTRQLEILFSHMGPRLPIMVEDLYVERRKRGSVLRADMRFGQGIRWVSGTLHIPRRILPDTMIGMVAGRPLRDVLDHPYIPVDLCAVDVDEEGGDLLLSAGRKT
jgi:hypothetical protein